MDLCRISELVGEKRGKKNDRVNEIYMDVELKRSLCLWFQAQGLYEVRGQSDKPRGLSDELASTKPSVITFPRCKTHKGCSPNRQRKDSIPNPIAHESHIPPFSTPRYFLLIKPFLTSISSPTTDNPINDLFLLRPFPRLMIKMTPFLLPMQILPRVTLTRLGAPVEMQPLAPHFRRQGVARSGQDIIDGRLILRGLWILKKEKE